MKRLRPKLKLSFTFFNKVHSWYTGWLKKIKFSPKTVAISFLHALLALCFTIWLQYLPYVHPDEQVVLEWYERIQNTLHKEKPKGIDEIVFVDVSKDIQVIPHADSLYEGAGTVITDRAKLAKFFAEAKKYPKNYKLIVCDLLFQGYSLQDSLLQQNIDGLPNCLFAAFETAGNDSRIYITPSQTGNIGYVANNDVFVKSNIYYKEQKSLPVKMFEATQTSRFNKHSSLISFNNRLSFRYLLPHFYLYDSKGVQANDYYNKIYLGLLVGIDSFFTAPVLKDKIIVLGNFERDIHRTPKGEMPGAVIITNTYLTLLNTHPYLPYLWLALLFLAYFLLSLRMFSSYKKLEQAAKKIKSKWLKKYLLDFLSGFSILQIINFFYYLYSGIFLSVFYMALYLTCLKFIVDKYSAVMSFIKKMIQKYKLAIPIILLLFVGNAVSSQPYKVSGITGTFTSKGKPLKKDDILTTADAIQCTSSFGKITLWNKANFVFHTISFINNKANMPHSSKLDGILTFFLNKAIPLTEIRITGDKEVDSLTRKISLAALEAGLQGEIISFHEGEELVLAVPEADYAAYKRLNLVFLLTDENGNHVSLNPAISRSSNVIKFSYFIDPEVLAQMHSSLFTIQAYLVNDKQVLKTFVAQGSYIETNKLHEEIKEQLDALHNQNICNAQAENIYCKKKFIFNWLSGTYGYVNTNLVNSFLNRLIK